MSADIWVSALLVGVPILAVVNLVGVVVLGVLQYRQSRLTAACFARLNDAFVALHDVNVKISDLAPWADVPHVKGQEPGKPTWKDLGQEPGNPIRKDLRAPCREADGVDAFPPQTTQPMKDNVPPRKGGE